MYRQVQSAMMLTKQQKAFATVAVLAALALAADRLFFAPAMVTADTSEFAIDASGDESSESNAAAQSATGPARASTLIAQRLDQIAQLESFDSAHVSDAFWPAWYIAPEPEQLPAMEEAAPTGPSPAERFQQQHRLTAVMGTGQTGYAVVDGQMLRLGQKIDGFTLTAISERSAIFELGDLRVELAVQIAGSHLDGAIIRTESADAAAAESAPH